MFIQNNAPGQDPFMTKKMRVVNRGGATDLLVGDVMALDLDASDPATQALQGVGGITLSNLTEAVFQNIVDVAAAPGNALIVVVDDLLSGEGVDDSEVQVTINGPTLAKVFGTDFTGAFTSCGVALMADLTAGSRRLIVAVNAANRGKVALITEAIDANVAVTAKQETNVEFFGLGSSVGAVGA